MKVSLILLSLISTSVTTSAQDTTLYKESKTLDNVAGLTYAILSDSCTSNNKHGPKYSLGNVHLSEYLQKKLNVPAIKELEITGQLVASFIVNKSGGVENINILISPHPKATDEISSALSKLKVFDPASCDDQSVSSIIYFTANLFPK